MEKNIRTYGGQRFRTVSIHDVDIGDFIKVGSNSSEWLVEIAEVESVRRGSWSIIGTDGLRYGMYNIRMYLKPEE